MEEERDFFKPTRARVGVDGRRLQLRGRESSSVADDVAAATLERRAKRFSFIVRELESWACEGAMLQRADLESAPSK